jgi:thiol-disulfide isomerase/thioredoxin
MYLLKFSALIYFFITAGFSLSQEVKNLSSTDQLNELFSSLKGKPVLVNIWATWCAPCVKEFPDLVKLYRNYKDNGFELVFISVDDKEDRDTKLPEFLKKQGVDFVSYFNEFKKPEEIIDYFDKSWGGEIPATYIYNRESEQVKKFIGKQKYEAFEDEIKKIL